MSAETPFSASTSSKRLDDVADFDRRGHVRTPADRIGTLIVTGMP